MDRAQAHTLEAVVAAILLLAGVAFALQATAVTPLTTSTSNQHLENQLQSTSQGVLAATAESGDLKRALLYWDENESEFHNADNEGFYTTSNSETNFTSALNRTFGPSNVAYNVNIIYHTSNGETAEQRLVRQGQPSDNAVAASRTVTLVDSDKLIAANGTQLNTPISAINTSFYAPDTGNVTSGNRAHYNHVRVEVVTWRI